jgi:hypothetical protein
MTKSTLEPSPSSDEQPDSPWPCDPSMGMRRTEPDILGVPAHGQGADGAAEGDRGLGSGKHGAPPAVRRADSSGTIWAHSPPRRLTSRTYVGDIPRRLA